jgi:hypothetical protein
MEISRWRQLAVKREITLVNHGRGLQLSTHRVRVQDLVPYFLDGCSHEEIIRWIPTLSEEEIAVVEEYYRAHEAELIAEHHLIEERNAARKNPEWVEKIMQNAREERLAIMKMLEAKRANGDAK